MPRFPWLSCNGSGFLGLLLGFLLFSLKAGLAVCSSRLEFTILSTLHGFIGFTGLVDWDERERSAGEIAGSLFPQFMNIAGVMAFPVTPPPLGQRSFGQPLRFIVQTTGTWEELDQTVQAMIARMTEKLQGHWMFEKPEAMNRLRMCEDCRVIDMFDKEDQLS